MSRTMLRTGMAIAAVTVAAAVTALPAQADPAAGSVVISESKAFIKSAAKAGIVATATSPATASGSKSTGYSATFPVTGGTGDIPNFYGNIQLGGGLSIYNAKKKKTVTYNQLAFSIDTYQVTGVKDGSTAATALLDVAGEPTASLIGVTPQTLVSDLAVSADGAAELNSALKTKFFKEGQAVGGLNITFTPETDPAPAP